MLNVEQEKLSSTVRGTKRGTKSASLLSSSNESAIFRGAQNALLKFSYFMIIAAHLRVFLSRAKFWFEGD
jgi:hypothetical protein